MTPADPARSAVVGIAVLARAPVPGTAKTRLIPALGAEGAARLQRWLLHRTVATALAADLGPVTLWIDGEPGEPDLPPGRPRPTVRRQQAGDLGARMLAALHQSPTPAGTLVIGSDCPALGPAELRLAAHALAEWDTVVFPAEDGGYVLLGTRSPDAGLFADVAWGTERVMAQTRARLARLGRRWAEPVTLWDLDRPADLERLFAAFPETRMFQPLPRTAS